ncbi:hypothetical protein CAEBREN_06560 [Caenorhabditis brenneri]|uniref:Chitin-binding type-2 domain-containing protein n=1 Tax=Caenorhabditis brenneri TaxID=135651 RepID=G0MLV4_CAEBE|nr:hypothetical protein CAEBREN_06560 [Caenorhabditis brenneri]
MRCFLFILLFWVPSALTDVIFTSERCNRVTYGLRTVNGDPSRYKQCGPSGRVWVVPCAPQMTFDPEDRVCKERPDGRMLKPMRKYETAPKTIITTPAPIPASYPVSAEVQVTPAALVAAPEEFVFSTIRPKSRKPKARTRGKLRKTTTIMTTTPLPTTIPMSMEIQKSMEEEETSTPKIVIFASKKNMMNKSEESSPRTRIRGGAEGGPPAFTRPGRIRTTTTPMPVTHATRFIPGLQKITVAPPKESQGMPHTLAPYEKMERRGENFGVEGMTTMTPEYTVRYNGQTMTENEFLNQLLHIVQHQKTVSERQQQDKFERMEQERLRQEKEEKAREMERRRQLEEAEKARQAEMDRQAAIYAEQERMAMERERELERIRQEERKREMERIRQEEIQMEIVRMRELERLQMERQQKNERVRQELEAARKQKILEEEQLREKIRKEQEEAREREMRRLEEERAREMERVREEEKQRQEQLDRRRQQEEERKKKKEMERRRQLEEERAREMERVREEEAERQQQMERRRQQEEERKRKLLEKEMEERQQAIYEEEKRREEEEERRREKDLEERRRIQEQMKKEIEERSRMEAMEREREMMRQIMESEKERIVEATTPITTIKPIYRPDINIYRPPDVESHMIRFTTQAPEWATPSPTWSPEWNTVTVEEETPGSPNIYSQCRINGECELKYDADSFCAHPSSPSMYLQCAPLYGRLGRWTERHCPDTLVFMVSIGRCEKGEELRKPYDPDNRVVIPRLPSETSFVEWKGNRVIDHHVPSPISPPRVYPPVPETHQPQIYNTIDEFPKDLLPKIPEVSPAETYAQQYQNHIHGSVISGAHSRPVAPPPTAAPIPMIPVSYQITRVPTAIPQNSMASNSIKSEIDLSHIHPLFPRVQPDFLSRILPSLNLKMHDEHQTGEPQSLGSVVKPVLKKIALNQTEQFLDRLLADQVQDEKVRKEIIDRLKSSNIEDLTKKAA